MNTPLLTPQSVHSSHTRQRSLAIFCGPLLLLSSLGSDSARAEVKFTPNNGKAAGWTTRLSSRKLSDLHKYSKRSNAREGPEQRQFEFCADSSFTFRGDFGESITPALADIGNDKSNTAQWEVESQGANAVLKLVFPNGSRASFMLSDRGGKIFLNGTRWLAAGAAECKKDKPQVSFAPWTLFFK